MKNNLSLSFLKDRRSFFDHLVLFLLLINVLYVFSGALHFSLSHIDVMGAWLYKAKALYLGGGSIEFLQNWQGEFGHPQYPILLPAFFAFVYYLLGGVNEVAVSLFSPVVYSLILGLCYWFLRHSYLRLSTTHALFFTYVYSMLSPLLAQSGRFHAGMPDIYLTLIYWLSLGALWKAQQFKLEQETGQKNEQKVRRGQNYWSWGVVGLAILASLIKVEGLLVVFFVMYLPNFSGKKFLKLVQVGVALSGFIFWQSFVVIAKIPSSYGLSWPGLSTLLARIHILLSEAVQELFFNFNNWYIFWWFFVLGILLAQKKKIKLSQFGQTIIQPLLLWCLGAFSLIYFFSAIPAIGYVSSSLDRLLLQISPLWLMMLVERANKLLMRQD